MCALFMITYVNENAFKNVVFSYFFKECLYKYLYICSPSVHGQIDNIKFKKIIFFTHFRLRPCNIWFID